MAKLDRPNDQESTKASRGSTIKKEKDNMHADMLKDGASLPIHISKSKGKQPRAYIKMK